MSPAPPQKELFARPAPTPGTIFVNDRVCVETEQGQRVLFVHGIVFSHYSIKDRSAEAYAMVQLFESGYADQNDIARCFGYSQSFVGFDHSQPGNVPFFRYSGHALDGIGGGSAAIEALNIAYDVED